MRTLTAVSPGLAERIQSRTAKIGIVGLGYVGLPLALLFSEQGFAVTGFDVDTRKVNSLSDGDSYIFRIPPSEIQSAQQHGFSATSEYTHVNHMDAVVICVPSWYRFHILSCHFRPDRRGHIRRITRRHWLFRSSQGCAS